MMKAPIKLQKIIIPALALLCLHPLVSPIVALLMGVLCALFIGNPYLAITEKLPGKTLALGIICLGGTMNLIEILQVGANGFVYTMISIALTMSIGLLLARILKVERESGVLITVGTAICGGSAIAAIAPVIFARSSAIAISLAVVFVMNGFALAVLPHIGHYLDMDQHGFGIWAALAVHDTSSVVGATLIYGEEALHTGTAVKLARALWIVPLVFAVQALYRLENLPADETRSKRKYPWFILGFLALAGLITFVPALATMGEWIAFCGRRVLVVTLFLIGTNIHKQVLKSVGFRPFALGVILWIIVASLSLAAITVGIVK